MSASIKEKHDLEMGFALNRKCPSFDYQKDNCRTYRGRGKGEMAGGGNHISKPIKA